MIATTARFISGASGRANNLRKRNGSAPNGSINIIGKWTASPRCTRSSIHFRPTNTQLYVRWQRELFAYDDIKLQLARGFARSGPQAPVTRFFTGHRGTGKTTELNRVKQMLERGSGEGGAGGRKIFVSFLECEKWVHLNKLERPT